MHPKYNTPDVAHISRLLDSHKIKNFISKFYFYKINYETN